MSEQACAGVRTIHRNGFCGGGVFLPLTIYSLTAASPYPSTPNLSDSNSVTPLPDRFNPPHSRLNPATCKQLNVLHSLDSHTPVASQSSYAANLHVAGGARHHARIIFSHVGVHASVVVPILVP